LGLKRVHKVLQGLGGALGRSWVFRPLIRRLVRGRVNVVYYHYVGDFTSYYADFYKGCTLERFRKDLEALRKIFEIVPLSKIIEFNQGDNLPEAPYLSVTFDDGFNLYRKDLMQILDEFGVKATTFVITSCLNNENLMWRNKLSVIRTTVKEDQYVPKFNDLMARFGGAPIRKGDQMMRATADWDMSRKDEWVDLLWKECDLPPLKEFLDEHRPYFTMDGLEDWIREGHSVGFHTHTHPFCSRLRSEDMEREIFAPALKLKERLGLETLPFSYPFGDRFQPDLEREAFDRTTFSCSFAIEGFAKRHTPNSRLEREEIEGAGAGWALLRGCFR
jgi:peptidoglycan/xylan/chitin deacetylase (PgdA/CDA1 family)